MVDYMFVFGKDIGNEYSKYISGETKVIGSYINNYVKEKKQMIISSHLYLNMIQFTKKNLYV